MRILIVSNNMHIGGVQRALVNLLWSIHTQHEITLLLFGACGSCLEELPADITVKQVDSAYRFLGLTREDVSHSLSERVGRAFYAGITRLFGRSRAICLMALGQKKITGYDAVISYIHNGGEKGFYGGCNDFVLRHVSAPRRISVLHCDYLLAGANTRENAQKYPRFDRIAACSEGCRAAFLQANPDLADKTMVVTNCHRYDVIQKKAAEASVHLPADKLNVVTVARLGREKGVGRAIQGIASLSDKKHLLRYYIIGDGIERPLIEGLIREHGLEDTVVLCGEMANPYGYMQAADLLLIPSLSEAAPLVIHEAACLGTPILSTETSSAEEMIGTSGLGWVCDNSVEGIADGLSDLIADRNRLAEKQNALKTQAFSNGEAVARFAELLRQE